MSKPINGLDIEQVAYRIDKDKNLLEILSENIQGLYDKTTNKNNDNALLIYEFNRIAPHLLALCDVLSDDIINNHNELTKLSKQAIHEN